MSQSPCGKLIRTALIIPKLDSFRGIRDAEECLSAQLGIRSCPGYGGNLGVGMHAKQKEIGGAWKSRLICATTHTCI